MMLEVESIRKSLGGLAVVDGCSLVVDQGEIVGLIGPNGAGKTTLFNVLTGSIEAERDGGTVKVQGRDVSRWPPHRIAQAGLVKTFQLPHLFESLSVLENLLVAVPQQAGERFWTVWAQPGRIRGEERVNEDAAWNILGFLGLTHVANDVAASLSGGQKKLVELGRALMAKPRILMLDEPVAGVNPTLAREIAERITDLRESGITFLIIEHNMDFIMRLADRIYVMAEGRILREGQPAEIRLDPTVLNAYLGSA
jgi:ABC-type branched-subunit amino acid transport system ATPase component